MSDTFNIEQLPAIAPAGQTSNCERVPGPAADKAVLLLSVLAFAFSLWAIHLGWHNSIYDSFSFRQTQTAITARYIQEGGPFLNYETPVLGPPWSIPFEFPLYQGLVAWTSNLFSIPLDQAGRLISATFFYLTLFPLYFCVKAVGVQKRQRIIFLALFALSPFYIFWSRTFTVESTALFFSVSYLALVLHATGTENQTTKPLVLAAIAFTGCLGGLIKITTFATIWLTGAAALFFVWWEKRDMRSLLQLLPLVMAACILPYLITAAWTHHADALKLQNPMAAVLTSKALMSWNFGTLEQRLRISSYAQFYPVVKSIIAGPVLLYLAAACALFARGRRFSVLLCCALWATTILIFFNLHFVHSYYAYANGIFLIAALGFIVVGLLERGEAWSWAGVYLLAFSMGALCLQYFVSFYKLQMTDFRGTSASAEIIKKATKPDDVILIYGLDWSSELPYQAHRRAIMNRYGLELEPRLRFALDHLAPRELGAVVTCGGIRNHPEAVRNLLHSLQFQDTPYGTASDCDVYVR